MFKKQGKARWDRDKHYLYDNRVNWMCRRILERAMIGQPVLLDLDFLHRMA